MAPPPQLLTRQSARPGGSSWCPRTFARPVGHVQREARPPARLRFSQEPLAGWAGEAGPTVLGCPSRHGPRVPDRRAQLDQSEQVAGCDGTVTRSGKTGGVIYGAWGQRKTLVPCSDSLGISRR